MTKKKIDFLLLALTALFATLYSSMPLLVASGAPISFFCKQGVLASALSALSIMAIFLLFYQPKKGTFAASEIFLSLFVLLTVYISKTDSFSSRTAIYYALSSLILLLFFKLFTKKSFLPLLEALISLNGLIISFSQFRYSLSKVPFHNPANIFASPSTQADSQLFLTAYLILSAIFTAKFFFKRLPSNSPLKSLALPIFFIYILAISLAGGWLAILTVAFLLFLYWLLTEKTSPIFSLLKKHPLVSAAVFTTLVIFMLSFSANSASKLPLSNYKTLSDSEKYIAIKLSLLNLGIRNFKAYPIGGIGIGKMPLKINAKIPPRTEQLFPKRFISNSGNSIVRILAETGLTGFLTITLVFFFIFSLSFRNFHVFENAKFSMVALLFLSFLALFTDILPFTPLHGLILLTFVIHLSEVLPETKFKKTFSFVSLFWLAIPFAFYMTAPKLLKAEYDALRYLYQANTALTEGLKAKAEYNSHYREYFKTAKQLSEKALIANPELLLAVKTRILALKDLGYRDEAEDAMLRLDKSFPGIFNSKLFLTELLHEKGDLPSSRLYIQKAIDETDAPEVYELLAKMHLRDREPEKAIFVLSTLHKACLEINQTDKASKFALQAAAIYAFEEQQQEARYWLGKVTDQKIKNTEEYALLASELAFRDNKPEEALNILSKAIESINPTPRLKNAIAYIWILRDNNLEKAEQYLDEAYNSLTSMPSPDLNAILETTHSMAALARTKYDFAKAESLYRAAYEGTPPEWKSLKQRRRNDLEALRQLKQSGF